MLDNPSWQHVRNPIAARLSEAGSSLPVIFITAVDDDTLKVEAVDEGCFAYLRKPFAAKLLLSAVHEATSGPLAAEDGAPTK